MAAPGTASPGGAGDRVAGWPGRRWSPVRTLAPAPPWRYGSFCWVPGGAPALWIAAGEEGAGARPPASGRCRLAAPLFAPAPVDAADGPLLQPIAAVTSGTPGALAWIACEPRGFPCRVAWSGGEDGQAAAPESVLATFDQDSELAAAATSRTRWIARSQQADARTPGFRVRLAAAGPRGTWREAAALGTDEFSCALAPLDDTTAVLATAGASGLRWAVLDAAGGARASGALDPVASRVLHVRLAGDPARGPVALWTTREGVHAARFFRGRWVERDSTRCPHPDGPDYWSSWLSPAPLAGGAIALAWGDRAFGAHARDVACFARRAPAGAWSEPGEIPGSEGAFQPFVCVDSLGDAWVAWSAPEGGTVRVCHTWCAATADAIMITRGAAGIALRARLSEPCPGSRWSVVEVGADGGERVLARVEAGPAAWLEAGVPPPGDGALRAGKPARYLLRRESLDPETRWDSPPVEEQGAR